MSHKDKLASARTLLEQFNSTAPKDKGVDVDRFFKRLDEAGGVSEEVLRECTWEDIEEFGAPRLLAKRIATVFREAGAEKPEGSAPAYVSEKRAVRMDDRDLVAAYNPSNVDNPVANELHKRSEGKRFLFVDDDNKVNVDASAAELDALRKGHSERDVAKAGGHTYTLRRVKDRPPTLADENPIYKGRALRPDGSCDQTNRSWANVPQEVRQLVRIAIDLGEASVRSIDDAHGLIDRAIAPNAEQSLRDRYVRTAARFDELKKLGEMPKLRVVFGGTPSRKSNDPFYGGSHVKY